MSQGMLGTIPLSEIRGPKNDLDEKLAGPNGRRWLREFNKFLRQETAWEISKGFEVTSDGRTGEQFIVDLNKSNYNVGNYAMNIMRKQAFISTSGKTYKLVVIKGEEFEDDDRITSKIRAEAEGRGYLTPPAEVAPLLRELVSDEEIERMGLWALVVMHEPITDSFGSPDILGLGREDSVRGLDAYDGRVDRSWYRRFGFVFLAS